MSPTRLTHLAIAVLAVLGFVCPCSAAEGERPSGKKTPHRTLRSPTDPPPRPIDAVPLRMRVETREGVLVVYDAAAPAEGEEGCSGYIGYWLSKRDKTKYIFPAVLQAPGDLAAVLLALERDLGADLEALADRDQRIEEALGALPEALNDETVWEPATLHRAVEIMGFDPGDEPDLNEAGADQPAYYCEPCPIPVGHPEDCGSPGDVAREGMAVAVVCCEDNPCYGVHCPPSTSCVSWHCSNGSCQGHVKVGNCESDGNFCTLDVCSGGVCTHPRKINGSPCPDDGNSCTDDVCSSGYCTHPAKPNGTSCPDDGDPCMYDYCVSGACTHPPNTGPCDDEDPCTENDLCVAGICDGTPRFCDDQVACTTDSCDPVSGWCEHAGDDAECDDGLYCNGVETCAEQGCQPGVNPCPPELVCDEEHEACVECITGADCDDDDPCTADSCWGWAGATAGWGGVAKGKCVNESLCPEGQTCCGGECCYAEDCCNDVCSSGSAVATGAVKVHPKTVTFGGANRYDIARDDGSGAYPSPHWEDHSNPKDDDNADVGDHNIPVVYARNAYMVLTAQFTVEPSDGLGSVTSATVRGDASGGGNTYTFQGTASVSGGTITLSAAQANVALPNSVQYYSPLTIAWTITPTGGAALSCSIPSTNHRVYVLLGTPNAGSRYETLIHLGCTNAAGKSTENDVVAAIWNDFTNRNVQRKPADGLNNPDGAQLTYYANWNCVNTTTAAVLANGDGQCGAWTSLMLDMLGAHGINPSCPYVQFFNRSIPDSSLGFLVKNWTFTSGSGSSGDPNYPYLNWERDVATIPGPPFAYPWITAEVTDDAGVAGQGNSNPASSFNNHQVVRIGTDYYDPSYGIKYGSLADIDNGAIAGYYLRELRFFDEPTIGVDLNADGDMLDIGVPVWAYRVQKNPAGNQLVERRATYPSLMVCPP